MLPSNTFFFNTDHTLVFSVGEKDGILMVKIVCGTFTLGNLKTSLRRVSA